MSAEPERLAVNLDEFRLAHARDITCSSSSSSRLDEVEKSSSSSEPAEFTAAVEPLERAAGRPLAGWGRNVCLEAFLENGDGFRRVVADAVERARTNAVGLCVRMVRDGDHRLRTPEPPMSPLEQRMREKGER